MDKSSSLGMPMSPQEISKRYKRQSLGMPPRHPFFIGKNQVTFQHTIFLLLHALCIFLGASLLLLSVFFFCCNKWMDTNKFLLEETHSVFYLPRTLYFSLLSFNKCSLFLELLTRVNSTNVLEEGLRIREVGRWMNSKVKSVKQGV
jgi:hypothetical protein